MPDDLDLRGVHDRHEPDPVFDRELRARVLAVLTDHSPIGEADLDPDGREDIIMLTSTPTEKAAPPRRRRSRLVPIAAAAAVVAIVVAIAARSGEDGEDRSRVAAGGDAVFDDTFDDDAGRWKSDPEVSLEGGQQVWAIATAGQLVHLRPLAQDEPRRDMEVTAEVASLDPDSTIGVHCRKGPANNDYYHYFRIGPAGAVIGVLPVEGSTPAEVLASDPAQPVPAAPFTIGARCTDAGGSTQLVLLLDGEPVLDASYDTPLPPGFGGLEVQAGARGSAASEVRLERFTLDDAG
jgi:hypothetical protein